MIGAVLFDYGETLVVPARPWEEARPDALGSVYRLLKRGGLQSTYSEYLKVNDAVFTRYTELEAKKNRDIDDRLKYIDLVRRLFPNLPEDKATNLASRANDVFWNAVVTNYQPREDAKECLRALKAMSLKMGIVSNHHSYDWLIKSLKRHRIERYFQSIIASSEVAVRKPNARIFNLCLSALDVKSEHAVFVGDSIQFDVVGARRAGLVAVLLGRASSSHPRPDFMIRELGEIPELVRKLNGV
jgi:HAD superfamily hydrolase (TIGR01549 family)